MKTPDRRRTELNEVLWWSNWAKLSWRGDGYLLSSDQLKEPFFNRAGSLTCNATAGTAKWAERQLSRRGQACTFLTFDSCGTTGSLLASGYRQVDTMHVLAFRGPAGGRRSDSAVVTSSDALPWTAAYLRSFYGNEELSERVTPIIARVSHAKSVTLLESRAKGETAAVMALFRTPGVMGAYCVGTVPGHRREGVATGLLAEAAEIAAAEGRPMILQTLESEGALSFYLKRGYEPLYSKLVLEKAQMAIEGAQIS